MFAYYFSLALRSLGRNAVLTVLMVAAIGVGIGTSMTVLTVFRAMSADPVAEKSSQLYAPQIDSWGPENKQPSSSVRYDGLQDQLTYTDALALMQAHAATRQTAMYRTSLILTPADPQLQALIVDVRATYGDFFSLFNVPFEYGESWGSADDDGHAAAVVITRKLNDRLFGGADSVGKTINLNNEEYRVAGVLGDWRPIPRFYDLNGDHYGEPEQVFLPFTHAVDRKMAVGGDVNCKQVGGGGWESFLRSDCVWIQFWVELPTPADAGSTGCSSATTRSSSGALAAFTGRRVPSCAMYVSGCATSASYRMRCVS
jgi:putative ABC transport system permease protein